MIAFIKNCRKIWNKYVEDEITVYAAQASFFIVLSFFPFIMLLLSLIQFIPAVSKSDLLAILIRLMPDMLDALVMGIVDDLYVKSPATILSVTALTALWSAARGMMSMERGMNRIYGTLEKRNYILRRLVCSFYTLIFMVVCIVSLVRQRDSKHLYPNVSSAENHYQTSHQLPQSVSSSAVFVHLRGTLHDPSKEKTKPLESDSRGRLHSHWMAAVFLFVFSLFYKFQQFFLYVWKSDCDCTSDAVAVFLHLHSFYRRRNQLLSGGTGILKSQRPGSARLALIQVNFQILPQLSEFLLMQTS